MPAATATKKKTATKKAVKKRPPVLMHRIRVEFNVKRSELVEILFDDETLPADPKADIVVSLESVTRALHSSCVDKRDGVNGRGFVREMAELLDYDASKIDVWLDDMQVLNDSKYMTKPVPCSGCGRL